MRLGRKSIAEARGSESTVRLRGRAAVAVVCIALSTAGAVQLAASAPAQERQEIARITRQAYFTRPASSATPPLLLEGFPPSTVCLVAGLAGLPEICGEAIKDLTDTIGVGDGLPIPPTLDADLIQPVLPGTMPVGMSAGQERYTSLVQLALPSLPAGEQFGSVELHLKADGTSFAVESPAFRQLVLAAVSQVSEQDPSAFADVFADVASGHTAAFAETITGIEMCPAVEPWDGGDAQNAGSGGERLPDTDCVLGTTGAFDEETSTWVFDITFAAQAWTTGGSDGSILANEGLLLRPLGAENLAYGDPDLSTNWLVSLADAEAVDELKPRIRYTTVPLPSDEATPTTTGVSPPADSGIVTPPADLDTPDVITPSDELDLGILRARYAEGARRAGGPGDLSAWLLLLLPIGLFGAWLLGESILATPEVAARRSGALSQLVRLRGVDPGGSEP